jgi:hypothetical protein
MFDLNNCLRKKFLVNGEMGRQEEINAQRAGQLDGHTD